MSSHNHYPKITAEEAVSHIKNGDTVAFSGFTPAGAAKATPRALATRAAEMNRKGEPFRLRILTGASCGESIDETLAQAGAVAWRAPYQSSPKLRQMINHQEVEYVDMHLSHVPQTVSFGFFGKINFAVIEATEITPDGRVFLTTSIGASPTYLKCADRVIIEINRHHSMRLREMADIMIVPPPPTGTRSRYMTPLAKSAGPMPRWIPRRSSVLWKTMSRTMFPPSARPAG
jgi:propionyl-CoA:succinyl-CoA transferase